MNPLFALSFPFRPTFLEIHSSSERKYVLIGCTVSQYIARGWWGFFAEGMFARGKVVIVVMLRVRRLCR